ncbi:MAG: ABC transporter permease [candidate division Zixibacteria bacterium]|nr:ABC transporter permease [candidate division Zixibacteria bacterium]
MSIIETIRIAVDSFARQKTRALLTMLGIIIGVGAVVAMVAVGQGATASVETQISSLGANVLMIFPGSTMQGGVRSGAGAGTTLTLDDILAIREQAPAVGAITPSAHANRQVIVGNLNWSTEIEGGYTDYFKIRDRQLNSGELFTEQDERSANKVCVLGQTVIDNLFPGQDPVGQMIRIQKIPFRVVGTLKARGQTGMGQDQDDLIVAPFSTVQRKLLNNNYIRMALVSAVTKERINEADTQISEILRQRHRIQPGEDDDFTIRSQADIAQAVGSTSRVMTILLGSIASVSLLVGGIGIMNIMLVSVTERTREVGLRMSLGARRRDILQQFLVESILLSLAGGIIGVGAGLAASAIISKIAGWATLVSPVSVAVAFLFSGAVGVFFGFYPARKASRLNPIEALRYE